MNIKEKLAREICFELEGLIKYLKGIPFNQLNKKCPQKKTVIEILQLAEDLRDLWPYRKSEQKNKGR